LKQSSTFKQLKNAPQQISVATLYASFSLGHKLVHFPPQTPHASSILPSWQPMKKYLPKKRPLVEQGFPKPS